MASAPWTYALSGPTRFLCADGELLAGLAPTNLVVGVHADAVDGGRMQLHDVGLVVCGRDLAGGVFQVPGV